MSHTIYTIGHSNLNFIDFISLIQEHHINLIIDIRSIPYSKNAPWSNKSRLSELLKPFKIRYTYLGHKLGGKQQSVPSISKQQGVTPQDIYHQSIQYLLRRSINDRIALLCAEANPENCHRQHFIAQTLLNADTKVCHILKNGDLIEAWKEEQPSNQPSLF